jgi:hypothetical protein
MEQIEMNKNKIWCERTATSMEQTKLNRPQKQ